MLETCRRALHEGARKIRSVRVSLSASSADVQLGDTMIPSSSDLALSLAESARLINTPQTLEETLDAIVRASLVSVAGFDHVGISLMHRDGTFETKAATDQLVWELDDLQYSMGEGPCVSAMREG